MTLAVTTDGSKLPPAVIFKGVRTRRDLAVPDSLVMYRSTRRAGWMRKVIIVVFLSLLQSLLHSDN